MENMGGDIGTVQTEVQGLEHGVGEERISSHAEAANDILSMTGLRGDALESKLRIKQAVQVLQQSNVADNLVADVAKIQMGVQGMEQGMGEERICSHLKVANGMENTGERCIQHVDGSVSHWRHTVDDHDSRGEATERLVQTNVGASPSGGNDIDNAISTSPHEQNNEADNLAGDAPDMNEVEIYNFLMKDNTVNGAGGVAQPGAGALEENTNEENTNVIRSWLMDDEVSTIGIWGMGGVGKTTMLERIYNELLERPDISHHVYWVTVSQDFSIYKLQNKIARLLHLDLSSEYEIQPRAAKLSEELVKKQKWILILDDLWESFDLCKVGIPIPLKGSKVIFTTRLEIICQQMGSKHKIKVKPLSNSETWTLFMDKLGHDIPLSLEVECIAKDVAKECAGLPIAITTMAGSLTGVDDLDEWRNTLKELKESKYSDMDEVFRILRFSYDRLYDLALQQCLLYCALFPEGQVIEREELISNLINVGIIERMESRQEALDKGHKMLNRLEGVCLLDRIDGGNAIKMHDLIRDMAIQIRKENPSVMDKVSRPKDPFWNHVEDMNGSSMKCKFCGHEFAKSTSVTRIKLHLSGERGRGVKICKDVPEEVQGIAFLAILDGTPGRKRKTVAGSRNNEVTIAIDVNMSDRENGTGEVAEKRLDAGESSRPGEKSGWTLLMTNLTLEFASAVSDQLSYALIGMVLAYVALLLATAELLYMARKKIMSLLPCFHRRSTSPSAPGEPVGTIVEYFGLVGAAWQCIYSTMQYSYARQQKANPIKMCLLPFIFVLCAAFSRLIKNRISLNGIFSYLKKW